MRRIIVIVSSVLIIVGVIFAAISVGLPEGELISPVQEVAPIKEPQLLGKVEPPASILTCLELDAKAYEVIAIAEEKGAQYFYLRLYREKEVDNPNQYRWYDLIQLSPKGVCTRLIGLELSINPLVPISRFLSKENAERFELQRYKTEVTKIGRNELQELLENQVYFSEEQINALKILGIPLPKGAVLLKKNDKVESGLQG